MGLNSYITLGRSGLRVSPFCLGTMTFGDDWGWGTSPEESATILAEFLDHGGNFIDTANMYTRGHSETIIGEFFAQRKGRRDRCVIATKFFGNLHIGDPNGGGGGRKAVLAQCEASLRRLQTDYIDVYWLHNWEPSTPIEETMRVLDDLVTAGKVRYIAFSDVPAWKTAQAQLTAQIHGWSPLIAIQAEYSLLERTAEGDLIPMAREFGLGIMPWSPLAMGRLSGKYTRENAGSVTSDRDYLTGAPTERDYGIIDALKAVAEEIGASPATVALAWIQGRPGVSSTIIGVRRLAQLQANLAALELTLSDAQIATLEAVSKPVLNFPADLNREAAPSLAFGGATVDGKLTMVLPMLVDKTQA